jgi:hypothetical protein
MLNTSSCDNIDIFYFPDVDGADADATIGDVYSCGGRTDSDGDGPQGDDGINNGWVSTGLCWYVELVDGLDGNPPTSEAIYGASAENIYIEFSVISTDKPRVIVKCNRDL